MTDVRWVGRDYALPSVPGEGEPRQSTDTTRHVPWTAGGCPSGETFPSSVSPVHPPGPTLVESESFAHPNPIPPLLSFMGRFVGGRRPESWYPIRGVGSSGSLTSGGLTVRPKVTPVDVSPSWSSSPKLPSRSSFPRPVPVSGCGGSCPPVRSVPRFDDPRPLSVGCRYLGVGTCRSLCKITVVKGCLRNPRNSPSTSQVSVSLPRTPWSGV